MDPLLDEDSHAIEISPATPEQINVGDIISYQTEMGVIIRRVVENRGDEEDGENGEDGEGIYYIVKGDNNKFHDPFKVRFADVVGVVVAIIY